VVRGGVEVDKTWKQALLEEGGPDSVRPGTWPAGEAPLFLRCLLGRTCGDRAFLGTALNDRFLVIPAYHYMKVLPIGIKHQTRRDNACTRGQSGVTW
jgi:hypothetical protein